MEKLDDVGIRGFGFRQTVGNGHEREVREVGRVWSVELSVNHCDGEASFKEDVGKLEVWV